MNNTSVAVLEILKSRVDPRRQSLLSRNPREEFRQHSYVSKVAVGVIAGLGVRGYALALQALAEMLQADGESAGA